MHVVLRRRVAFVAALCLALASCGGRSSSDESSPSDSPVPAAAPAATDDSRPKVVVLGDSLTAGLGLVESQSFPALLQKKADDAALEFEIVNGGVSGDTSAGGLRRLDWALQGDVRVLIVALGANDGLRGLSVYEMKQNLGRIIEEGRQKGAVVILAGMEAPPNYGQEYAMSFRQAYRDVALEYKVQFIPFLLDKVAGVPALNQADGIHPNAQGAAIVADTVWAVLGPILEQIASS